MDDTVYAIALQADGRVLIGGAFSQVGAGMRQHLARLNVDGSLDTTFAADADGVVSALVVQDDGKPVLSGGFATIGGQARHHIARLNADGSVDAAFDPDADGDGISALVLQPMASCSWADSSARSADSRGIALRD